MTSFAMTTSAVNFHLDHMSGEDMRSALIWLSGREERMFAESVLHARGIGSRDGALEDPIGYLNREAERSTSGYVCSGWACTDCLFMIANGDEPSDMNSDEQLATWREHYQATTRDYRVTLGMLREDHSCPEGTEECDCEVIPFSGSRCDVCGTRLAGERHAVSFFAA